MGIINFAAGPAALPAKVIQRIHKNSHNWQGSGSSIMEISHRSSQYLRLHRQLQKRLRRLLKIPKSHKLLLLSGGARAQFSAVPLNIGTFSPSLSPTTSSNNIPALYIISGYWSNMAAKMAQPLVKVVPMLYDLDSTGVERLMLISDNKEEMMKAIEIKQAWQLASNILSKYTGKASYMHCCLNETVDGLRMPQLPATDGIPLVADISSCIAAYPLDFSKMDLAYACAQKNLGIAGLTLVSINSTLLEIEAAVETPHVLSYQRQAAADSLLNTPTTFAVYVCDLMCEWIEEQGGIAKLAKINQRKAAAIYEQIDTSNGFYINTLSKFRSLTNVVFMLSSRKLEKKFVDEATASGLLNLRGHSIDGGIRVSIYNAISENEVMKLCDFMKRFKMNYLKSKLRLPSKHHSRANAV